MTPLLSAFYALLAFALVLASSLTSASPGPRPAEISMQEFTEMCTYFPGMLHCPGISLEKRSSSEGFLRGLFGVSQQFDTIPVVPGVRRKNAFIRYGRR